MLSNYENLDGTSCAIIPSHDQRETSTPLWGTCLFCFVYLNDCDRGWMSLAWGARPILEGRLDARLEIQVNRMHNWNSRE